MTESPQIAPYGTWKSPITPESLTESASHITTVLVDDVTKDLYFLESRPSEGGRQVLVKLKDGKDIFGREWNARTRVHEYGGVSATIHAGVAYFSHASDGRVYKVREGDGGRPVAVTPENSKWRFAELTVVPQHPDIILAVLEDHTKPEPANVINKLVAIRTHDQSVQTIAESADFYASPKLSPDGTKLTWIQWFHPDMPCTATELVLANFNVGESIKLTNQEVLISGRDRQKKLSSIQQPDWLTNDDILFLSDQSGYVNPWTFTLPSTAAAAPPASGKAKLNAPNGTISEDFCVSPAWILGDSDYAILSRSLVVHGSVREGHSVFSAWDLNKRTYIYLSTPYSHVESVKRLSPSELVFLGHKDDDSPAIVKLTLKSINDEPIYDVLKSTWTGKFPRELVSKPETFTFPVPPSNKPIHVVYYPPHNPKFKPLEGELPPALVVLHGGPTGRFYILLKWTIQFWTSRGWAVLDVLYGGSSGYGRAYMDRIQNQWGIVDVDDTIAAIQQFIKRGMVDPKRIAMRGQSSSGLTNMGVLIKEPNLVGAATSIYGVSDLLKLEEFTHKFESHYLDYLLGGTSADFMDVYVERSPITHADKIKTPLLIMQGLDDAVVPPEQSETIVQKVRNAGGKVKYITFEGEGHGWRKAETIKRSQQAELDWYEEVFKFKAKSSL